MLSIYRRVKNEGERVEVEDLGIGQDSREYLDDSLLEAGGTVDKRISSTCYIKHHFN
jgi:hypothetical protein